nr:hypothetical protein [Tanacetum cinerariifolium]
QDWGVDLQSYTASRLGRGLTVLYRIKTGAWTYSLIPQDDLLSNGVQTEIVDRKFAYLTNQHDVTTSCTGVENMLINSSSAT